jgi:hypothetical protein
MAIQLMGKMTSFSEDGFPEENVLSLAAQNPLFHSFAIGHRGDILSIVRQLPTDPFLISALAQSELFMGHIMFYSDEALAFAGGLTLDVKQMLENLPAFRILMNSDRTWSDMCILIETAVDQMPYESQLESYQSLTPPVANVVFRKHILFMALYGRAWLPILAIMVLNSFS